MSLETAILWPDTHVPYEDKKAVDLVLRVCRRIRPDKIVLMGDFADMYEVSDHDKDPNRRHNFDSEIAAVNKRLDQIEELGTEVVYIFGNHEFRMDRYLMRRAPELYNSVSLHRLFRIKDRGWQHVPYRRSFKIGKLHLTHDVGFAGASAHSKSRQEFEGNVAIVHTHRLAIEYRGKHVGAMLGWLGDRSKIDYTHQAKTAAWVTAFGIAYHDTRSGNVHLQPVPIIDYRCVVNGELI